VRAEPLRVLFILRHEGYLRNFEAFIRELDARGHETRIVFDKPSSEWNLEQDLAQELERASSGISIVEGPGRVRGARTARARHLRLALDFLRYLEPDYDSAPKLRNRGRRDTPPVFRTIAEHLPRRARLALERVLVEYERTLETDALVDSFIGEQRPDVVLVTPLVSLGSDQADYVWSAARRGIPTCHLVASWDNLTNKGRIRAPVDLVAVWNEAQRAEAIALHGRDPSTVVVTGAHSYDHWFSWKPSTSRTHFCRRVGLREDRPFILYMCSSLFIAPLERPFVLEWAQSLRRDPSIGELGILVRPHPQNAEQWADAHDTDEPDNFAVFPRAGETPVGEQARRDYFDSIYHATAVVGVNTSALIESAIVGRPVYTVTSDEWSETQRGTLHFAHLIDGPAPLLTESATLEEHVRQLGLLGETDSDEVESRNRRFLESFVRPHGLDRPAAPVLADAVEQTARSPDRPALVPPSTSGRAYVPLRWTLIGRRTWLRPVAIAGWLSRGGWRVVLEKATRGARSREAQR
jgi:hypothetical protein